MFNKDEALRRLVCDDKDNNNQAFDKVTSKLHNDSLAPKEFQLFLDFVFERNLFRKEYLGDGEKTMRLLYIGESKHGSLTWDSETYRSFLKTLFDHGLLSKE